MESEKLSDAMNWRCAIKKFDSSKKISKEELVEWSKKQVYIALGVLLTAAEKKIDSCPMEGFDKQKFDLILKLNEKGLTATVICPLGYRSIEDKYSKQKKFRFEKKRCF